MIESQIIVFLLILTRVSAFIGFFTLFSFRQLPRLIKAGVAVGLSVFWFGQLPEDAAANFSSSGVIGGSLLMIREFAIGVTLAIVINLFFMPAKVAGAYIGQELGLSLASISSPGTPDSATLITRVFETFTVLLFFLLNLHHFFILVLDYSFKSLWGRIDILNLPTERLTKMLHLTSDYGLTIVGPLAVLLGVITVGIAILNRVAPTLNLFSVGMSLRTGFGIFCMVLLLPVLFNALRGHLIRIQNDIEQLLLAFL